MRLDDRSVREAFDKTRIAVRDKHDADGFYKAIHNRDEFALAVLDIVGVFCKENPQNMIDLANRHKLKVKVVIF